MGDRHSHTPTVRRIPGQIANRQLPAHYDGLLKQRPAYLPADPVDDHDVSGHLKPANNRECGDKHNRTSPAQDHAAY